MPLQLPEITLPRVEGMKPIQSQYLMEKALLLDSTGTVENLLRAGLLTDTEVAADFLSSVGKLKLPDDPTEEIKPATARKFFSIIENAADALAHGDFFIRNLGEPAREALKGLPKDTKGKEDVVEIFRDKSGAITGYRRETPEGEVFREFKGGPVTAIGYTPPEAQRGAMDWQVEKEAEGPAEKFVEKATAAAERGVPAATGPPAPPSAPFLGAKAPQVSEESDIHARLRDMGLVSTGTPGGVPPGAPSTPLPPVDPDFMKHLERRGFTVPPSPPSSHVGLRAGPHGFVTAPTSPEQVDFTQLAEQPYLKAPPRQPKDEFEAAQMRVQERLDADAADALDRKARKAADLAKRKKEYGPPPKTIEEKAAYQVALEKEKERLRGGATGGKKVRARFTKTGAEAEFDAVQDMGSHYRVTLGGKSTDVPKNNLEIL
jgi:hypothetical protein